MTSSVADVANDEGTVEHQTTTRRCLTCLITRSLDDDQPALGTVRWKVTSRDRIKVGIAVSFECLNGHSSDEDPDLLKGFPSRRF
jgi:hypothetical protein